jgi:hypothetical protein
VVVTAMALGCIALGAGVYGTFLRPGPGLWYGPWLLAAGAVVCASYLLFGRTSSTPLHVGELGVGFEDDAGKVGRTAWYEITKIALVHDVLRLTTAGRPLSVALDVYPTGAARVLAEALERIPKRVGVDPADQDRVLALRGAAPSETAAEPPQVTSLRCRASDQPLTFERDVRMCGRCGVLYHRTSVPPRCAECGKKLKK